MPKFTGDISDVKASSGARVDPSNFVKPRGGEAQVLGGLLQGLAGQARVNQERNQQLEAGRAIGEAQTSVLDLMDERNSLVQEDVAIQNQVANIYKDNTVTPEEQETLNKLQERKKFLEDSRTTGVLNESVFQTRMNALQRQSLAAVQNLGIQTQINAVFSQGRSQADVGVPREVLAFNKEMDSIYGVGNWTAEDAGRKRGAALFNAQALEQASVDVTTIQANAPQVYGNLVDNALIRLTKSVNENGALMDEDADMFRATVLQQYATATKQVNDIVAQIQADPNKRLSKEHLESVQKAREGLLSMRDNYLSLLSSEGGKLGSAAFPERIKKAAELQKNLTTLQNPQTASAITGAIGSGSISLMEWADALGNEATLNTVYNHLPPILRENLTVADMKNQIASAIHAQLKPGVTLKDMVDNGLISKPLAQSLSFLSIPKAKTPEEVDTALSILNTEDAKDRKAYIKYLRSPSVKSSVKGWQGETKATGKKNLNNTFSNYATSFTAELEDFNDLEVSYNNKTGEVVVKHTPINRRVPLPIVDKAFSKELTDYMALVKEYKGLIDFTVEDALGIITPQGESPQATPSQPDDLEGQQLEGFEDGLYEFKGRVYEVKDGVINVRA